MTKTSYYQQNLKQNVQAALSAGKRETMHFPPHWLKKPSTFALIG